MDTWKVLWQNVIEKTIPPIKDMAAVFKFEYDNFSYTLRGNANLFGEMDRQVGRAMVDGGGMANNSSIESGPRLRMISSTPHHDLNTLLSKYAYTDDGGWTGADSTYMRRLPDDRHVFMFSDTFLGRVEANGSRARDTPFVSNSFVVIERDGTMRTLSVRLLPVRPERFSRRVVISSIGSVAPMSPARNPARSASTVIPRPSSTTLMNSPTCGAAMS